MNKWVSVKHDPPDVKKTTDMIVWFANGTWTNWRQCPGDSMPFYPGITHWMIIEAPDSPVSLWSRIVGWFKV